jgi:predicted negative regulator of RcsB-dependent stress response
MDEDIAIIDEKTRNEKIKNFFVQNKKLLVVSILFIVLIFLSFYLFQIYENKNREALSNKFNTSLIDYKNGDKNKVVTILKEVINEKDSTYSPLALYFIIDNDLIGNSNEINTLFDILIEKTSLETEIKNLIIYKKGLYNADSSSENDLLEILNPIINSNSLWKSHALYLVAEYFYSKNEKKKSKEFFNQILNLDNANQEIKIETQKRLNRDLSD